MAEDREEKVIITDGGSRGSGGTIAVVVLLLVAIVVLYLIFGQGLVGGGTEKIEADVKIDAPTGGGTQ